MGIATAQIIQMLDPSHVVMMLDPYLSKGIYGHALLQQSDAHILRRGESAARVNFRDFEAESFARGAASLAARFFLFGDEGGQPS